MTITYFTVQSALLAMAFLLSNPVAVTVVLMLCVIVNVHSTKQS